MTGPKVHSVRSKQEEEDAAFLSWYLPHAEQLGLDPNPDSPLHFYDWRSAWKAGAEPDADGHWPSDYKLLGHPNLFVDGLDTRTQKPASPDMVMQSDYVRRKINERMGNR